MAESSWSTDGTRDPKVIGQFTFHPEYSGGFLYLYMFVITPDQGSQGPIHKFIGGEERGHEPKEAILCLKYKGENAPWGSYFDVSEQNDLITCKACNELIHS